MDGSNVGGWMGEVMRIRIMQLKRRLAAACGVHDGAWISVLQILYLEEIIFPHQRNCEMNLSILQMFGRARLVPIQDGGFRDLQEMQRLFEIAS
jgi:hypothetical protein